MVDHEVMDKEPRSDGTFVTMEIRRGYKIAPAALTKAACCSTIAVGLSPLLTWVKSVVMKKAQQR